MNPGLLHWRDGGEKHMNDPNTIANMQVEAQQNLQNEPPHDKTNKMKMRPAKTQIRLGIHPVWSENS